MDFDLKPQQAEAAAAIQKFLHSSRQQRFLLGGFAGTGKTFLLQRIINDLGSFGGKEIICCAPTGKAASVLRSKLNGRNVRTIHSVLYSPIQEDAARLQTLMEAQINDPNNEDLAKEIIREKKKLAKKKVGFAVKMESEIIPGQLIIIDEASMVTEQMFKDLAATEAKLLFVGDPGQLPPVGDGGWFAKAKFDYVLTEVQRQALDSPIIRMSMDVREQTLKKSNYQFDDCRISDKSEVSNDDWLNADQVITGKNHSRHRINRFYRKKLGFDHSKIPLAGEKIICLKNHQDTGVPYVNGVQCLTTANSRYDDIGEFLIDMEYEGAPLVEVQAYDFHFLSNYQDDLVKEPWFAVRDLQEFDFAYGITVHKSQGSEWDRVIIADDRIMATDREFRKRWLYTAITRAKVSLIWSQ